jgi:5-methylcytosine-specific restriction endonuclease McrA
MTDPPQQPFWKRSGFPTRKKYEARVRDIANTAVLDADLENVTAAWILTHVLAYHHSHTEKLATLDPGGGFGTVQVRLNVKKGSPPTRGFYLVSKDRTVTTDFSWSKLKGNPHKCKPVVEDHINAAARAVANVSASEFRREQLRRGIVPQCALCGTLTPHFEADHHPTMFIDIYLQWRQVFPGDLTTMDVGIGRAFADPATAADFRGHHDARASFRLLCGHCHKVQPKGPKRHHVVYSGAGPSST